MKRTTLRKTILGCCLAFLSGTAVCSQTAAPTEPVVVPRPQSFRTESGTFRFSAGTTIAVPADSLLPLARTFAGLFTRSAGFTPRVRVSSTGDVRLSPDPSLGSEAYRLHVSRAHITIHASDARGYFYALQSLRQLLPPAVEDTTRRSVRWEVPACRITDRPRFAYRGFMLDVARYFLPKEDLLRLIDCLALLKINTLHLHLTDDNGWRLEIRKYPRLTQVGAWRVDRPGQAFPDRRNALPGEKATVGGYYTQDDMRGIIRYAADRRIEIIPEIDVPAHSNAALAAYPEYACPVVHDFIGVIPGMGGRHSRIIFCAGNDRTYTFLQDILDEVMQLFPSRYIHLGGDEANKTYWKECPLCQERIRKEHLSGEEALQGYFMERLSAYVRSHGKTVMGWDELTNSSIPPGAVVFGWQGDGRAALKAAAAGHRFVLTPARVAYLIRYQGPQWFEPVTYFGNNTLSDLYAYEPVQPDWKPAYAPLLLGVQASLWTEFCNTPHDVFYLSFPRVAALAEVGWTDPRQKDWPLFLQGLDRYLAHLRHKGIPYARSMYNLSHRILPDGHGALRLTLACERPDVEIRFTTDGSEPCPTSARYTAPLTLTAPAVIRAATFAGGVRRGEVLSLPVRFSLTTACRLDPAEERQGEGILVNGLRGSLKETDSEWIASSPGRPLTATIDLGRLRPVSRCTVGCLLHYGMAVQLPRSVTVEVSDDGHTFRTVARSDYPDSEVFAEGNSVRDLSFPLDGVTARYLRVTAIPAGLCPPDHVRPGQPAKVCIDEVMAE